MFLIFTLQILQVISHCCFDLFLVCVCSQILTRILSLVFVGSIDFLAFIASLLSSSKMLWLGAFVVGGHKDKFFIKYKHLE